MGRHGMVSDETLGRDRGGVGWAASEYREIIFQGRHFVKWCGVSDEVSKCNRWGSEYERMPATEIKWAGSGSHTLKTERLLLCQVGV